MRSRAFSEFFEHRIRFLSRHLDQPAKTWSVWRVEEGEELKRRRQTRRSTPFCLRSDDTNNPSSNTPPLPPTPNNNPGYFCLINEPHSRSFSRSHLHRHCERIACSLSSSGFVQDASLSSLNSARRSLEVLLLPLSPQCLQTLFHEHFDPRVRRSCC